MNYHDIVIAMSGSALIISFVNAWWNFFRPPKIECAFTYLYFNKCQPNVGTRILEQYLIPCFSLRNLGTKSAMITGLRFRFFVHDKEFFAYPVGAVPLQYIEYIKSHNEQFRENDCPFGELLLEQDEIWKNNYLFALWPNQIEEYSHLGGDGLFEIQVRYKRWCCEKWHLVKQKAYKMHIPWCFDNKTVARINILTQRQ